MVFVQATEAARARNRVLQKPGRTADDFGEFSLRRGKETWTEVWKAEVC